MKITIVTPRRPGVASGNDVTSERWARRLVGLGHDVTVVSSAAEHVGDPGAGSDLLVALHARRSAGAVAASRAHAPGRPVIVGLAGTDLYRDLPDDATARASIETADRLVVLQAAALDRLEAIDHRLAAKAHVVGQSVEPPLPDREPPSDRFVVAVLSHLRDVKDPLLAARAVRSLPSTSRIEVLHAGHPHDEEWRRRAVAEQATNQRYQWLGELDRTRALELVAGSTVLACTSQLEGGANVVTEAIALGVPVVGTDIDGNRGLLGEDYPGLVPVGDAAALADWLIALENQPQLTADLSRRVRKLQPLTSPAAERAAWQEVLSSI